MDGPTAGAWIVGALAGLGLALFIRKKTPAKADPEDKLRELIGPRGMALLERNRVERDAKWKAELLASVEASIKKLREAGDAAGAGNLEAFAETLRARRRAGG